MAEFQLDFSGDQLTGDIKREGSRFAEDGGLVEAILFSLFLNRRANPDDELPAGDDDRQGYWGDTFSIFDGDLTGSRLWLLRRSALTNETLTRAKEYALESLEHFKEDGVANEIRVETEIRGLEELAIGVEMDQQEGGTQRFSFVWDRIGGGISSGA